MEIIIQGHKIDTKDIWDIEHISDTRSVWIIIKVVGKPNINIGRNIPYETRQGEFQQYWQPYQKLYDDLKAKWEADKTDLQIFKL